MHAHRYDISDIPLARLDPIETGNWGVNTLHALQEYKGENKGIRRRNGLGGAVIQLGFNSQPSDTEPERENVELSLLKNTPFPERYFRVEFPADRLDYEVDIISFSIEHIGEQKIATRFK